MEKLLFLPEPKKKVVKKYFLFLLPTVIGFLIVLISFQKTTFFFFQRAQFMTSLWPILPTIHFAFSRDLFNKGQKELADKELAIGKKQVESLNKIYLGFLFKSDLTRTEMVINQEEDVKKQLDILEEQLEKTPYCWQLLLKRAVLAYKIYRDEEAKKAWELAFWLDPNNEEVLGLKEKLSAGWRINSQD